MPSDYKISKQSKEKASSESKQLILALDFDGPIGDKTLEAERLRSAPAMYQDEKSFVAVKPDFEALKEDEVLVNFGNASTPREVYFTREPTTDNRESYFYSTCILNHQQIALALSILEEGGVPVYCASQKAAAKNSSERKERAAYQVTHQAFSLLGKEGAILQRRMGEVDKYLSEPQEGSNTQKYLEKLTKETSDAVTQLIAKANSQSSDHKFKDLTMEQLEEFGKLEKSRKLKISLKSELYNKKELGGGLSAEEEDKYQQLSTEINGITDRFDQLLNIQTDITDDKQKLKTLNLIKYQLAFKDFAPILDSNKNLLLTAISDIAKVPFAQIFLADDDIRFETPTKDFGADFIKLSQTRSLDPMRDNAELIEKYLLSFFSAEYIYQLTDKNDEASSAVKRQFFFHPLLLNKLYQETYVGHLENGAKFDENFASIKEQSPALAATLCLMHGIKLREAHHYEKAQEYFAQFKQWATTQCMPEDIQDQLIRDLKSPFNEMTSAEYTKLCEAKIESLGSEQVLKIWYALEDQFSDPVLRKEKFLQTLQQFPVAQQKAFYDAVNKIRAEIVDANDTAQLFIEVADELEQKFSTSDTDEAVDASVIPDISEQVRIAVLTPHVKFDSKNLVVQLLQVDKIVLNREVHFQLKHIGQSQEQKSIKGLSGGISGDAPPIAAIAERATMHLNPAETGDEDATAREHATNFTFINKEPAPNPDIIPLQEGEKEIDYRTRVEEKVKQRILQLKTNPAIKEYLIKFLNQKAMFGAFGDYIMRDINALSTITPDLIGDFIASKSFASLFEGSKKYTLEVEENQAIYTHEFYSSETPPTVIGLFRFKILPDGGDKIKIILENAEIEVSANTLKPTSVYVSGGKQKLVDFPKLLQETLCKQAYNFAAASNQNITIDHITALMLELEKRLIANGIAEDQVGSFIKPLAKKLERLLHPEKNQAELKKIIREQLEPICTSESILTANAFTALRKTFTPEQLLQLKDYAEFNTFAIHLREADRYSLVAQMLQYVNDILNDRKRTYHFTKVEIVALLKNLHGFEPALVGYHEGSMLQFAMQVLEDELEHTLKSTNTTIKELLEEFDSNVKPEDYRHIRYQLQRAALTPQVSFDQDGNLLPKVTVDPWRLQGAMKRVGRMISSEKILSEKQGTEAAQALARKLPTDIYDPKLAFQFMGPRRVLDPKFTEDTPITRGGNVFINVNGKNIFEFKNESQKARSTEEAYRVFNTDVLPLLLKNLDPSIMTYLKGFIGMPFGLTNQQIPLKVLAADFALKFLNLTIPDDQKELFTQFLLGTDSENLNWNFFIKDKDNLTISVTTSRQQLIFSLQKQLDGRVLILPTRVSCIIADKKELGGQQCKLEKLSGNDAITLLPCENSTSDSFSAYDSWKKVYTQISSKLQQQKALDFNDVTATLLKIETLLLKAPENLTSEEIKNHLALWANQLNYLVNENQAYLGGILQQGLLPLLTSYDNGSSPDQPLTQALDNLYWEYFTSQKFILPHLEQISRHEILNRESESYAQNRPAYAVNAALKETLEKLSNERGISLAEKKIISKAIDDAAYVLTASIRHKPGELHINELLNVLADAPSFQLTPASNTAPKETSRDLPASALEQLSKNFEDLKPLSQKALKDLFVNIGNDNAQAPKAQSVVNRTATYFPKIAVNMAHHLDGSQVSSMIKGMQKIQRPSYNQEDKSATIVAKAELARSTAEQTRLFGDVIGGKVSFKAWWAGAPFNPFKKPKYTAEQLKDLILADPSSLEQVFSVKANRELFANTPAFRELLNTFLISLDDSKTVNTIFNIISQYPDLQISPIRIRDLIVKECFQKAQESHLHDLTDFLKGYCRILNAFDNEKCYDNLVEVRNIIMSGLEDRFIAARKPGLTEVGVTGHSKDRYESRIKEFLDVQQRLAIETEDSINREAIIFGILDKLKALIDSAVQSNQSKADKKPTESALKTGLITVDGVPTAEGIANAIEIGQLCILLASNVTHQQDNADDATPKIVDTIRKWQRSKNSTFLTFDQIITSDMQNNLEQYINESEAKYWMTQVITSGLYAKDVPDSPQLSVNTKPVTATAAIPPTTPTVQRRLGTPQSLGYDVLDAQISGTAASAVGVYDQHQGKRFADLLTAPHVSLDTKREGADQQAADIKTQPSQQPIAPGTASLVTNVSLDARREEADQQAADIETQPSQQPIARGTASLVTKFDPQMFLTPEPSTDGVLAGDTTRRSPSPRRGQPEEV